MAWNVMVGLRKVSDSLNKMLVGLRKDLNGLWKVSE